MKYKQKVGGHQVNRIMLNLPKITRGRLWGEKVSLRAARHLAMVAKQNSPERQPQNLPRRPGQIGYLIRLYPSFRAWKYGIYYGVQAARHARILDRRVDTIRFLWLTRAMDREFLAAGNFALDDTGDYILQNVDRFK